MSNLLKTDAYKFSMAEAGFPLRVETFYYTHRRGGHCGWHFIPIDIEKHIKHILPNTTDSEAEYDYLKNNSYAMGSAYRKAISTRDVIRVKSMPEGSWFYNREPVFSVTGPSAIASWLEPSLLMLNFIIQVATQAKVYKLPEKMLATCENEKESIQWACALIGRKSPEIEVRPEEYYKTILKKAISLVDVVGGNPDRIFEVGMRAVSCMDQHEIALKAIKAAGILRTSNVYLAQKLGMIPVGTMGHEHIQRFGNDYQSFITMRDRCPGFISYLPDTFDSIRLGIPSALRAIQETPDRKAGVRFDSEERIKNHYLYTITECLRLGLNPQLILEGGWNLEKTIIFEKFRNMLEWPSGLQSYGFGGYLVNPTWATFQRDDVAAVWKLSKSGSMATMKFGDDSGHSKQSAPGLPVTFRPYPLSARDNRPIGLIGQEGEKIPEYYCVSDCKDISYNPDFGNVEPPQYSPETQKLIKICNANREKNFSE